MITSYSESRAVVCAVFDTSSAFVVFSSSGSATLNSSLCGCPSLICCSTLATNCSVSGASEGSAAFFFSAKGISPSSVVSGDSCDATSPTRRVTTGRRCSSAEAFCCEELSGTSSVFSIASWSQSSTVNANHRLHPSTRQIGVRRLACSLRGRLAEPPTTTPSPPPPLGITQRRRTNSHWSSS